MKWRAEVFNSLAKFWLGFRQSKIMDLKKKSEEEIAFNQGFGQMFGHQSPRKKWSPSLVKRSVACSATEGIFSKTLYTDWRVQKVIVELVKFGRRLIRRSVMCLATEVDKADVAKI